MSNIFRMQETGRLVNRSALQRALPNVSFPKGRITQASLEGLGVDVVHSKPRPTYEEHQTAFLGAPVQEDDGLWYQNWIVQDRYVEYTDADGVVHTVADQKAAVQADLDQQQAERNRRERNALLEKTDWWAVSDRTMSPEDIAYRQALRDITTHVNWPNLEEADWPTKPS